MDTTPRKREQARWTVIDYGLSNSHSCGDKRAYPTKGDAKHAQMRHLRALKNKYEKLAAYKCLSCKQWHLGHPARKVGYGTRKKDTVRDNRVSDEY